MSFGMKLVAGRRKISRNVTHFLGWVNYSPRFQQQNTVSTCVEIGTNVRESSSRPLPYRQFPDALIAYDHTISGTKPLGAALSL
jgi:hypothetical protein